LLVTPGGTTINKLAVAADGQVLTTDAASTNGVKWSAPTAGTLGLTGLSFMTSGAGTLTGSATTGDSIYASGTNTWAKLAIGSAGQVKKVVSGVPAWGNRRQVVTKSANFTASDGDGTFYVITASSAIAVTLPAASAGQILEFAVVSGTGTVTFTGNGAETIQSGGQPVTTTCVMNGGAAAGVVRLTGISGGWIQN